MANPPSKQADSALPEPLSGSREAPQKTSDPTTEEAARSERAVEYVSQVWKLDKRECPICTANLWQVDPVANLPVRNIQDPTNLYSAERVYPLVPVMCQSCGFTFFFNEKMVEREDPTALPLDEEEGRS